ncbi:MAG TPA: TIR domain-containing protein [Pyrinomonadaceae bacterium]
MDGVALFSGSELSEYLSFQSARIEKLVLGIGAQRLLNIDIEKIVLEITKKLSVNPIVLLEQEITVNNKETKVDVSKDPFRYVHDRKKPVYVSGTKVTYYVPFQGNVELLKLKPNRYNYNPPHVTKIVKNELLLEYVITDGNVKQTKRDFDNNIADIKQWVRYTNDQIENHNQSLVEPIRSQLLNRQQILISSQQQINELGYKIRPKQTRTPKAKAQIKEAVPRKTKQVKKATIKKNIEAELEYDVALSFAGEDRAYVEKVAQRLKAKGVKVFYDNFNKVQLWGNNLIDHLGEVYSKRSRFIVMFISKYYAEKEWTNHERKFAQERAFKLKKNCILPVRFDNTSIPGLPSTLGYINLQKVTPIQLADLIVEKLKT